MSLRSKIPDGDSSSSSFLLATSAPLQSLSKPPDLKESTKPEPSLQLRSTQRIEVDEIKIATPTDSETKFAVEEWKVSSTPTQDAQDKAVRLDVIPPELMPEVEHTQESDQRQLHRPLEKQKDVAVEIRPSVVSHSAQLPLDSTQRVDIADECLNIEQTQISEKNLGDELDKNAEPMASPLSQTGEVTETDEYSSIAENKTATDESKTAREAYSTSDEEEAIVLTPQPAMSRALRPAKKTSKNMKFQPESQVNLKRSREVNKAKLPLVVQEKAQDHLGCIIF